MKIAVISNGAITLYNFRGPLLSEMVRRGHEVLAFAPDHDDRSRAELAAIGVTAVDYSISRSGTNPLEEFRTIFQLRYIIKQLDPDICFSYFIKPVIYGTIAAWLSGVRRNYGLIAGLGFSFTEIEGKSFKRRILRHVISQMTRFAARKMEYLMFQNKDDHSEFIGRGIIPPNKAIMIGATGVDPDDWPQTAIPDAPITFLLAARLLRDKGVADYVDAARIVRKSYPDARFILLGGIDNNPAAIMRDEVEGWVKEGLIEWPGHVSVKPWLARAHVFVLPSYYREGVPRSIQEAMAFGRPIITTDMPGCRDTVIEGENGFLVPPRDPISLAEAMSRFIINTDIIRTYGAASRQLVLKRFDVRNQNVKLLNCMNIA